MSEGGCIGCFHNVQEHETTKEIDPEETGLESLKEGGLNTEEFNG